MIVPIWKRKGDVHDQGNYRDITLLSHVLKLIERVLDARIRRRVEGDFGQEQQGFSKRRRTADGMHVLRQMVEKRLGVQGSLGLEFVDLERAYDTVGPTQRDGDGDAAVDGCIRSGSEGA